MKMEDLTMLQPRKRIALDGKTWWCVFDTSTMKWSTNIFFTKYKTKRDCLYAIDTWKQFVTQFCALS